jgi:hypothetical protein
MTITPERLDEIRVFASNDETCPAHCLVVRDLIDEVEALRTKLLAMRDRAWRAEAAIRPRHEGIE